MARYSVTFHSIVHARTEAEAKAKVARKFKKELLRAEALPETKMVNYDSHCKHGLPYSSYCDWC